MSEFIKINYKSVLRIVTLKNQTRSPNKNFYHKVNIIVHAFLLILFHEDIQLLLIYKKKKKTEK